MVPLPNHPGLYACSTEGCEMVGRLEVRTSQRDALARMTGRALLVHGGNRAGKTALGLAFAVAVAAGSDEPWVRDWMTLNGIPDSVVPAKPGRVLVSASIPAASIRLHRPTLEELLPEGTTLHGWKKNEASALLPNGGRIDLTAGYLGREAFRGSWDLAILDELHSETVFQELLRSLDRPAGRVLVLWTPTKLGWVHEVFAGAEPWEHAQTVRLSGLDNPHVDSGALVKMVKPLPARERRARLLGEWAT